MTVLMKKANLFIALGGEPNKLIMRGDVKPVWSN